MTPNPAYWAAQCAAFSDGHLLRFIIACENRRDRYEVALTAAVTEAHKRRLTPNKKGPAMTPGQSREET